MTAKEIIDNLIMTPSDAAAEPATKGEAVLGFVLLVVIVVLFMVL